MSIIKKFVNRYTGFLRSFKWVYTINNLLNRDKLAHNKELYKQHGIERSIFGPIGHHQFESDSKDLPWLDHPDALDRLKSHPSFKELDSAIQHQLINFVENGYMILKGFYNEDEINLLDQEIQNLLQSNQADYNYSGRKIMDAFRLSDYVDKQFFRNPKLLELLEFTMGKKIVPFQTINFNEGSEQKAHSDSIHMTTEPPGYLIASWTAMEDISEESGPLFYYPGSHRLPFVSCQDYLSGNTKWTIGNESYKRYEDQIEAILDQQSFEKKFFLAEKGDVLLWHANLLHGGSPIKTPGKTRKSMVAHYFCEGVICYHEISQRPALLELNK